MKKILKTTAAIAILACSVMTASGIPSRPFPQKLVNDFAGILDYGQSMKLESRLSAFSDSTSNQIAVVTVLDLEGLSPIEYGTEIGHVWGVGSDKFDNGIVILVKPKTADSQGQVSISIGYGLEGAIPDSYASRIISEYMLPAFRTGNYYEGIDSACTVLMKLASGEISEPEDNGGQFPGMFVFIIMIVIIIALFRRGGRNGGRNGGNHDNRQRKGLNDDFVRGLIIGSILNSGSNHSNSGGFGGGSFGGGFGGFGGGSFGGGGASGNW